MKAQRYTPEHHCVRPSNLDPLARSVIERLAHNGFSAYLVGGGVRDMLLHKKPKDLDIATDATPRAIKSLFRNSRIIGRRFKLAQVFFGRDKIFEVSTFRDMTPSIGGPEDSEEQETVTSPISDDNRFGTEETDALRRDITINGLYFDPISGAIIDYVGGIEDIRAKLIRIIGDPDVRIAEDPVRMIRVVRHAARSGFKIEEKTAEAVLRNTNLIHQCTDVRVFDEFKKDILSGHFLKIARLLGAMGLLEALLPLVNTAILESQTPFSETMERIDEMVQGGELFDLFIPLTLLALFSRAPEGGTQFGNSSEARDEREQYLTAFFARMAVPRRERERVFATAQLIGELFSDGLTGNFSGERWSFKALEDAELLLRILPSSGHDRLVYRLLRDAKNGEFREPMEDSGEKRGRRRRRNRNRHPRKS